MGFSEEELNYIYDKTRGYCYHCGKKLSWRDYGILGTKGAWEMGHSKSKAQEGTDYLRNLVPSCIYCNRSKGSLNSRQYRRYLE